MASAVQTTYPDGIAKGFPGLVANQETQNRITRTCQDVAGVEFGKPAFRGTVDGTFTGLLAADETTARFLGVTIADIGVASADKYAKGDDAGLLDKGLIWVNAAVAVTQGDPVFITQAETWSNVTSADALALDPERAEWEITTGAAGLALLRLK